MKLTLRATALRARRTLSTAAILAVAVAVILSTSALAAGFTERFQGLQDRRTGDVYTIASHGVPLTESRVDPRTLSDTLEDADAWSPEILAAAHAKLHGDVEVEVRGVDLGRAAQVERLETQGIDELEPGEALLGVELREALGLQVDDTLTLRLESAVELTVVGTVETGGPYDTAVLTTHADARQLTRLPSDAYSLVKAKIPDGATTSPPDGLEMEPESGIPAALASVRRQVGDALTLLALTVGAIALVGVYSSTRSALEDSRRDVGLLKALGSPTKRVTAAYLAWATLVGVLGWTLGATAALLLTHGVGLSVYLLEPALYVAPTFQLTPLVYTLLASLSITLTASAWHSRRLAQVPPRRAMA